MQSGLENKFVSIKTDKPFSKNLPSSCLELKSFSLSEHYWFVNMQKASSIIKLTDL
jgi:hypothetical protein